MPDANDELRKRILDDEPSALPVGDTWRAALVSRFDAQRKKLLVLATVWLLAGMAIMFFGAHLLGFAPDLKLMLLAVAVILIGYESTVLIKLWYWVADTNVRVIREVKQLQLLSVAGPAQAHSDSPGAAGSLTASSQPDTGASGWNRVSMGTLQWLSIAALLGVAAVGTWLCLLPLGRSAPLAELEEHTRIAADGRCEIIGRQQYPYAGMTPLESIQIRSAIALENPIWREANAGVLPHSVARHGEAYIYTLRLLQPVFRGEPIDLRTSASAGQLVRRDGDHWVYQADWQWIHPRPPALTISPARSHPTRKTVTLPPGASVEAVTPAAKMQWGDYDGCLILYFEAPVEGPRPEDIRIVYRLPAGRPSSQASGAN